MEGGIHTTSSHRLIRQLVKVENVTVENCYDFLKVMVFGKDAPQSFKTAQGLANLGIYFDQAFKSLDIVRRNLSTEF
jgi:hypothetical protein